MFVTFEGIDYSGKSTQAQRLRRRLEEEHGRDPGRWPAVRFLREPGGTEISERVRSLLLTNAHASMADRTELLLFAAARAQLVDEVIRPALQDGSIVLCDRFADSTTAYQGYGRGLDLDAVARLNAFATAGLVPDLTILVDIPVDEVDRRRRAAGGTADRMEEAGRAFFERVRSGYRALAGEEPARFVVLDGLEAPDDVERAVWQSVVQRFQGRRG